MNFSKIFKNTQNFIQEKTLGFTKKNGVSFEKIRYVAKRPIERVSIPLKSVSESKTLKNVSKNASIAKNVVSDKSKQLRSLILRKPSHETQPLSLEETAALINSMERDASFVKVFEEGENIVIKGANADGSREFEFIVGQNGLGVRKTSANNGKVSKREERVLSAIRTALEME